MTWALEAAGPAAIAAIMSTVTPKARIPYTRTTRRPKLQSRSLTMPQWAPNQSKASAAQYEEEVIEASIQESLSFHLNPYRAPLSTP